MQLLFRYSIILSVSCLAIIGCQSGENKEVRQSNVLAVVNDENITIAEYQKVLGVIKSAGKGYFTDGEGVNRVKRELLERMINSRLLVQEAKKKNIVLDPKVPQVAMDFVFRQYPPGGVEEELLKRNKTLDSYRADTEQSLLIHKLLKREVVDRIAVSADEVKKYFLEHPSEFKKPEEVRVRQIVVKSEEEAENLRKQILRGSSFEELAKKHSLGPEGIKGGDLGFFSRGRMPPAIEDACFSLWSSHVSKIVPSPYGFHLFKLIDRRSARELTLEEARNEIEQKLISAKTQEAESYYIRSLRENAIIQRDLSLLDRIH
jgi:peptidyl-prolyl cis-trans isomerase C/foldase protein PrsA